MELFIKFSKLNYLVAINSKGRYTLERIRQSNTSSIKVFQNAFFSAHSKKGSKLIEIISILVDWSKLRKIRVFLIIFKKASQDSQKFPNNT